MPDAKDGGVEIPLCEVRNRRELMAHCFRASNGDRSSVLLCMRAYSPPAERLILSSLTDFVSLGMTPEQLHAAADESFWAYKDFYNVVESFARDADDPERRVLGIEGIGSAASLHAVFEIGQKVLRIGHLSHAMMRSKVANGEWRWIDEKDCVMHTATPKPAFLREELRQRLGLDPRVLRHESFLDTQIGSAQVSEGDLIIFDIDKADVSRETGNTKVFCQDPSKLQVAAYKTLDESLRSAVDAMFTLELKSLPPEGEDP